MLAHKLIAVGSAITCGLLISWSALDTGDDSGEGADALSLAGRIGLTAESMAAAGFTDDEAAALMGRIESAAAECAAVEQGQAQADEHAQRITIALQSLFDFPDSQALRAEYADALADYEASLIACSGALAELKSAALDGVSSEAIVALESVEESLAYRVSDELRVVERSMEEWQALERACAEEVRAGRDGNVEISTESLATLADARNDAPVIEAQEAIEANLDDITATISGQ